MKRHLLKITMILGKLQSGAITIEILFKLYWMKLWNSIGKPIYHGVNWERPILGYGLLGANWSVLIPHLDKTIRTNAQSILLRSSRTELSQIIWGYCQCYDTVIYFLYYNNRLSSTGNSIPLISLVVEPNTRNNEILNDSFKINYIYFGYREKEAFIYFIK